MPISLQASRAAWRAWSARHTRVARYALYLLAILATAIFLHVLGILRPPAAVIIPLSALSLIPLLLILLYRWIMCRLLWTVRNRLIVTYLFMGLSPIVLFGTLTVIATYLFAGQFETTEIRSSLDKALVAMRDETASAAILNLQHSAPAKLESSASSGSHISIAVLNNNTWRPLLASSDNGAAQPSPFAGQAPAAWMKPPFRGIVEFDHHLFLCAVIPLVTGKTTTLVLGSMPLNTDTLSKMTEGLGKVTIGPSYTHLSQNHKKIHVGAPAHIQVKTQATNVDVGAPDDIDIPEAASVDVEIPAQDFHSVEGGTLPPPQRFFDKPIIFSGPIDVTAWDSGENLGASTIVFSRPTALYARLFATSAETGRVVRISLIVIASVFACIEFLALLMAFGLSRTITRSVADLYRGTRELDGGNLTHRIRVKRDDQLGALATSFNRMAGSISDLLIQQREKERLLSELAIAQEVQTTLLPQSPATVPGFEVHALCQPARTVGGDYFDFIFGPGPRICLALGDISGKGIPAALLMASLHSAVRAFTLGLSDGVSPSPAQLLKLLNHHLYASTQTARYATLFLACYETDTRKLTYSNGGHLPPLILSADGAVRKLECGGPVVGLLENLEYEEETVQLRSGDLLMAFTDGVTEPENDAEEEFGVDRLLRTVHGRSAEALPSIAAGTLQVLRQWIGNREQPDDMTLLLAREL